MGPRTILINKEALKIKLHIDSDLKAKEGIFILFFFTEILLIGWDTMFVPVFYWYLIKYCNYPCTYIHLYLKFSIWAFELVLIQFQGKKILEKKPVLHPQTLTALMLQGILAKKVSLTYLAVTVVLFYWVIFGESNTSHPFNTFTGCQCCNLRGEFSELQESISWQWW